MPFLNPIVFVTGAAAASLPIIIHLLNRRRFRIRDWAAMRFLLASLRKNRKRLRIEELILLAIRTLIVLLLAIALGRFTGFTDVLMGLGGEDTRTVVLILDDSYSMGQSHGDVKLWDMARQDLTGRIEQLRETDRVAVILTSRPGEKIFFPAQQLTDPETLINDLQGMELSDLRTSLPDALGIAEEILASEAGTKELVVLSDMRQIDLDSGAEGKELEKRFQALRDADVSLTVLDYGAGPNRNVTIESLALADRLVVANRPATFSVTIRNNGPNEIKDLKISVAAVRQKDQGLVETNSDPVVIEKLAPGATVQEMFEYKFPAPGPAVMQVSVLEDDLPGDDMRHLAMEVQPALKVLIVDGGSPADGIYGVSVMLKTLLSPNPDFPFLYGFDPRVRYYSELEGVDFDAYDMVILSDVADMPQRLDEKGQIVYPKLRELEKYVASGGGLMIFAGDRLQTSFYNGPMYAEGMGLNPFKIAAPVLAADIVKDKSRPFLQISPNNIASHPGLDKSFRETPEVMASVYHFGKFTPIDVTASRSPDAEKPRVLMSLADPADPTQPVSPLLVQHSFGQGSVLICYTSSNDDWSDWPVDDFGTFLVLVQDSTLAMARTSRSDNTDTLPAQISLKLPARLGGPFEAALVEFPTGQLGKAKAQRRYDKLIADLEELAIDAPEELAKPLEDRVLKLKQESAAAGGLMTPQQIQQLKQVHDSVAELVQQLDSSPAQQRAVNQLKLSPQQMARHELSWPKIRSAGLYRLDINASAKVKQNAGIPDHLLIARNVDPEEGQIAPARRELIEQVVGPVSSYQARARDLDWDEEAASDDDDTSWWAWIMGALAAMVLLETVLGLKFGHYTRAQKQG